MVIFLATLFCVASARAALWNGGYKVAGDVAAVAERVVDERPEALLYAGLWQGGDGKPAPSAPMPFYGLNWTGTETDWVGMYDVATGVDVPEQAFFRREDGPGQAKTMHPQGGFLQLGRNESSGYWGSEPLVLYGRSKETRDAISFASNATYQLQYRVQFVYRALQTHLFSGLRHGALAAVAPPVFWGEKNATVAEPRALAAVYHTGLPRESDKAFTPGQYMKQFSDFHEDAAAVGFELGPKFFCLNRKCCNGKIPSVFFWYNFVYEFSNVSEYNESLSEKCDWRLRSDFPGQSMRVSEEHLPFPEHSDNAWINHNIPWEGISLGFSDWYTVTLTLLPPGYVQGVELPARAYNFSFVGPNAGMIAPQTFVGVPPAPEGLGVGIGGQHGGANVCNVTLRRLLSMEELRALAAQEEATQATAAETHASSDTTPQATGVSVNATETATLTPSENASSPREGSGGEKKPARNVASGPAVNGPFFVSALVFLFVACSFAGVSFAKACKARAAVSVERRKILGEDAEAAELARPRARAKFPAWKGSEREEAEEEGIVMESVYGRGQTRASRSASQSAVRVSGKGTAAGKSKRT